MRNIITYKRVSWWYPLFLLLTILCTSDYVYAQKRPLEVKFRSRGLFDLGYTSEQSRLYPSINDLRVGAKVSQQAWSFKMDIGLSGSKISIKDLLFSYNFGSSYITLGNAYEPFNMDMVTGSVDLRFNESASSSQSISNGRRFGVTYYMLPKNYFGAIGIYTDNSINDLFDSKTTSTAIALTTKHLYRRCNGNDKLFQIGGAFSFRTVDNNRDYTKAGVVEISSVGSSNLTGGEIISAKIDHSLYNLKGNIELLSIFDRWMIQSELSATYIVRETDYVNYRAYGGYLQLSYLFGRSTYGYDYDLALPVRPGKGGLEVTARVDYVNANDKSSNIFGGEHTDISLGVNYFFNKYFAAKLNVNYTFVADGASSVYRSNFLSSVLRLQYCF